MRRHRNSCSSQICDELCWTKKEKKRRKKKEKASRPHRAPECHVLTSLVGISWLPYDLSWSVGLLVLCVPFLQTLYVRTGIHRGLSSGTRSSCTMGTLCSWRTLVLYTHRPGRKYKHRLISVSEAKWVLHFRSEWQGVAVRTWYGMMHVIFFYESFLQPLLLWV